MPAWTGVLRGCWVGVYAGQGEVFRDGEVEVSVDEVAELWGEEFEGGEEWMSSHCEGVW